MTQNLESCVIGTKPIATIKRLTMSEMDESSASKSSASEEGPAWILRKRSDAAPVPVVRRKSPRNKARNAAPSIAQMRLPTNKDDLAVHIQRVSRHLNGCDYTDAISARVLKAVFTLQYQYLERKEKAGKGRVKKPSIRETMSDLFGVSPNTLSSILHQYFKEEWKLYASDAQGKGRTGGGYKGKWRIPNTESNIVSCRNFVQTQRVAKKKVTAVQVTHHFIEVGVLNIPKDEFGIYKKKAMHAGIRATRRFLVRNGYCRGTKKGSISVSPENIAKRDLFLQTIIKNRALPPGQRRREVYLDESYIHHHYQWKPSENLYDPADKHEYGSKDKHKGERYCFVCAIQGPATIP
jgi:hypothetical protein